MCFPCDADDASISPEARTVGLCAAIVAACLLAVAGYRWYREHAAKGETRDAGEMRWVKPSFSASGAAPLAIYAKVSGVTGAKQ